ncbi:MAG: hypothetical protein H9806_02775 [Candidatus Lactobacillus pullistercoris]|uniref:Uncharacterized protein n=1 Tax=Candidatus Lactobacillus pullistercoris TaxID=2838636 RepID=A0A9E2NTI9_9LACO|nr:hypothetical protein [Candidatus Lactobacillus pullistercoris]
MLKNFDKENQEYVDYVIEDVTQAIAKKYNLNLTTAHDSFLHSQTYQLLIKNPKLYWHDSSDYFYDLWQNEQKYGHPIPSFLLELEGKI